MTQSELPSTSFAEEFFSGESVDILEEELDNFSYMSREKLKKIGIYMTPSLRQTFDNIAKKNDMSLSEFLRVAAFAAIEDPSILQRASAMEAEKNYKTTLGPSRWTR